MPQASAAQAEPETRAIALVTRELAIRPDSFNEADNTVEVVWTTGARGQRFDWRRWEMIDEELSTDTKAVRLDRLNRGAPVLNTHGNYELEDQIGVVVDGSARMENGEGIATVRLSKRESVASIVQDIKDKIIRNLSVGYRVHEYEITERDGERPLYRAVDWEPYEISFVPMPFDAGAQVRSGEPAQGGHPCIFRRHPATEETPMPPENTPAAGTPAATETRASATGVQPAAAETRTPEQPAPNAQAAQSAPAAAINAEAVRAAARNAGLDDAAVIDLLGRHADQPFTRDALMADIGRRFAERDTPATTVNRVPAQAGSNVTIGRAMEDAIFHRLSPGSELSDAGRNFRGMTLLRMAEEMLGTGGVNCRGLTGVEIAERALHTTSDFPALMSSAMHRRLRQSYQENQPTYRRWARRAPNAPNFKSIDVVQLSAMPDLLKVNEAGEFKYGSASDGKVSYNVLTYGRIIAISRQTIVNDDLRALDRAATGFAGSAARLENRTVYAQITGNPVMPDGVALFHASHGNLAGSGAAIANASLSAGRKAVRLQKGLQSEELNLAPKFLLAPASLEQAAYQYTSSQFVPNTAGGVNEFRQGGRTELEPIIESILDANSATAWYLACDNNQVDTVEYCFLEGSEGVQISDRIGFTVDGVEIKASLDFAAATIDHRGLYKDPGA